MTKEYEVLVPYIIKINESFLGKKEAKSKLNEMLQYISQGDTAYFGVGYGYNIKRRMKIKKIKESLKCINYDKGTNNTDS